MITVRPAKERGHANHGWLDTYHSFSFADYHEPQHMGFSVLRVLNDDRVAAAGGFPPHGHRDMEIVTYVLDGGLQHRDSMGNGSVIRPGVVQRMSAGTGVTHSEFNASRHDPVHLIQIWILPNARDLEPSYEEKPLAAAEAATGMSLVASPDGRAGSVTIHQDASLYVARLDAGESARLDLAPGRKAYVHVAIGDAALNDVPLTDGDGARVVDETGIRLNSKGGAEVLVFDLP
jgi:redox-sensitive bicupin YhaK (pirin superfamily)